MRAHAHTHTHTHTLSQFPASSHSLMGSELVLKSFKPCPDALFAASHMGYNKTQDSTDLKPALVN